MTKAKADFRIGVISDTHGLLRPEVISLLQGVDHILHAGDVGDAKLLDRLNAIAPVSAIRGNIDTAGPCSLLPATEMIELAGVVVYLVHSLEDLDIHPSSAGVRLVVSGHSHKALVEHRQGVTYLNPGSVGPRRFRLPVTMAFVNVSGAEFQIEQVEISA